MHLGPTTSTPIGRARLWRLWTAPTLPRHSNYLVANALDPEQGAAVFPCLWLRGCLPLGYIKVLTPVPQEETFTYLDAEFSGWWPSCTLWTDASGGTFGSVKRLRRCGVGIASLSTGSGPVRLAWGAWGPLSGELQIVRRGELYIIIIALERTDPHLPLMVASRRTPRSM